MTGELGGDDAQYVFVVERALHSKPATDILRDHADLGLRNFQNLAGKGAANGVRPLDGAAQGVAFVALIVLGKATARLHRIRRDPVDHHAMLHHMCGRRKGAIDRSVVAHFVEIGLIVWIGLVRAGRTGLDGFLDVGDRGEGLVVHLDRLRGILRLMQCLSRHKGYGITGKVNDIARERGL